LDRPADRTGATDGSLAEAAQGGDVRALETLLDRHEAKVLRVLGFLGVAAQDREDVAQEIFIRVFKHIGSFRRGLPFGAWLYRVTVNASHDYRRRGERTGQDEVSWTEGLDVADEGSGPAEALRHAELQQALHDALDRLSERERAVFVLREIEGLESADVARALGITRITVRRHLGRARRRLQRELRSHRGPTSISVERIAPDGSSHG
jgi:RNA polymerase sigma-70 factor (ECF subfamily)